MVVPLSALTDHTLNAPELLSGLITPSLPRACLQPPARIQPPRALRQLLFVLPTYYLCAGKVRQNPFILWYKILRKLVENFHSTLVTFFFPFKSG